MKRTVSIVLQGDLRPESPAAVRAARESLPGCELIVSTWHGAMPIPELDLCDRVVFSDDPGPLPTSGPLRNLRRQVVSTMAGLDAAKGEIAVKSRTDIILHGEHLLRHVDVLQEEKIAVWRNFTSSPYKTRHLFHASDLLQVATLELARSYWEGDIPDSLAESTLLPEQYLLLRYLAKREAIGPEFQQYLPPSFANLHLHNRCFAQYLHILPREVATLPERLRPYDEVIQRDEDFSGKLAESIWMCVALRLYPFKAAARQWVCRRRAEKAKRAAAKG